LTESQYWHDHVRPKLSGFGKLVRIENAAQLGTPDVAYCLRFGLTEPAAAGWIELKHLDSAPKRGGTIKIDHLTIEQVQFMEGWTAAGGRAWLLIRIDSYHLLLRASSARPLFRGERTLTGLLDEAAVWSNSAFPAGRILRELTRVI